MSKHAGQAKFEIIVKQCLYVWPGQSHSLRLILPENRKWKCTYEQNVLCVVMCFVLDLFNITFLYFFPLFKLVSFELR